jgi:hypothetical protein
MDILSLRVGDHCPDPLIIVRPVKAIICAVSGGYAYVIDTNAPERFTMIAYRPVLELRPLPAQGLLLFAGHHSILAWGAYGQAWQSGRLFYGQKTDFSGDFQRPNLRMWEILDGIFFERC